MGRGLGRYSGAGAVTEHKGDYHDAVHVKGNSLVLTVHSLWGGMAPAVGPSDYYPKYESKYFRFESKPKYVKIL